MSNVTLAIAGRDYTVACAPGEEEHVVMLGGTIDAKLAGLPNLGSQPDARRFLYAALLLADELHEARAGAGTGSQTADALEATASALEQVAAELEARGA